MMRIDELLGYLFEGCDHVLYQQLETSMRASRPFRAFAETYRDKIRKKIRTAKDAESVKDLSFELAVAYRLVQERRFQVEYEKHGPGKHRSPDFTVMFRTRVPFNVEVTRLRPGKADPRNENPARSTLSKLMEVICDKLGQMPPQVINVLMLSAAGNLEEKDLAQAGLRLIRLADQKAEDYFAERGFKTAADFYRQFQKLSAMMLEPVPGDGASPAIWLNPIARQPLLKELMVVLEKRTAPSG